VTEGDGGRLIVGISGASGPHYGVRLLEVLRERTAVEVHLVLSRGARETIAYEMRRDPEEVLALAHATYEESELAAPPASGSFLTRGMVVVPCSIKSLSAIANSYNDSLISRAADVCLKERRTLVLVVRETPLHHGHLRLMDLATLSGATILPPVPGFYHRPVTIDDLLDHTVMKILDAFGLHLDLVQRWEGPER
jgi:4-hydroxy-3-polyprenylbenzoate decarboxylase